MLFCNDWHLIFTLLYSSGFDHNLTDFLIYYCTAVIYFIHVAMYWLNKLYTSKDIHNILGYTVET